MAWTFTEEEEVDYNGGLEEEHGELVVSEAFNM